jgi:hypothetical protein
MSQISLAKDEERLWDAYDAAVSNLESMAGANHWVASEARVLGAVRRESSGGLFELCNLPALNLARVTIPDFLPRRRKGLFPRQPSPAQQTGVAREVHRLLDQLLAAGFVAGLAVGALRGEELRVDTNTPIYPDAAIAWYWENISAAVWAELDADPVASDLLTTLTRGDVAYLARYADEAERSRGSTPDPIESSARGEFIARRGYSLYWAHTKSIHDQFGDELLTGMARASLRPPHRS